MLPKLNPLLDAFRSNNGNHQPQKITFDGVVGYDVYNPSIPFQYEGRLLMAARVEKRDSERSIVRFFEALNETHYSVCDDLPTFTLQDPFVTQIGSQWVFGGTHVDWEHSFWFTRLYVGPDLHHLKPLVDAPKGMKDVRIIACQDGSIGVFTRPQGGEAYGGTIGFTTVPTLADLTTEKIAQAPLLSLIETQAWSGVNDVLLLPDGTLGVVGHVATFEPDQLRHYFAMVFTLDPKTGQTTPMRVLAERSDFLPGPAKRDDLHDVIFTAGLYKESGVYYLYVGTSDCEVQRCICPVPFEV